MKTIRHNKDWVALPIDYFDNERGNTWLCTEDQHILWFSLGNNRWIEVSIVPDNYPGAEISIISSSKKQLAKHIRRVCSRWTVRKLNIAGVSVDKNGMIV